MNIPQSSEKLHNFYVGMKETFDFMRKQLAPKIKEAHAPSGGFIRLREVGEAGDANSQLYTRLSHKSIVAGDRVLVLNLADGESIVLGRLHVSGEDDSGGIQLREDNVIEVSTAGFINFETGLDLNSQNVSLDTAYTDGRYIQRTLPYRFSGSLQGGRVASLLNVASLPTLSGITLTANRAYYCPVWMPESDNIIGATFNITTAVTGNVRVGIYDVTSAFLPGARLAQSTTVSQSSTGSKQMAFSAPYYATGGRWYFMALVSATAMAISGSGVAGSIPALRGGASGFGETFIIMGQEDLGSTTLPATASAGSGGSNSYVHVAGYT